MRIRSEFIRLPLSFDSDRLLTEVKALPKESWITHPLDPLNLAIILISVGGTINDEFANEGQMLPTPYLKMCPYIQQVLASFHTPFSRSRLMIIPPGEKCGLHDDICLHWYRRTRVHVPIVTNEKVKFICNDKSIHMRAGEAWIFDNFLPHAVLNEGEATRIHLVADTMGSASFWNLVAAGQSPFDPQYLRDSDFTRLAYAPQATAGLWVEPYAFDTLTSAELAGFAQEILAAAKTEFSDARMVHAVDSALKRLVHNWSSAQAEHGNAKDALPTYAAIMREFTDSPLGQKLAEKLPRYSNAGNALGVMQDLFLRTMRSDNVQPTPDPELLNRTLKRMGSPYSGGNGGNDVTNGQNGGAM